MMKERYRFVSVLLIISLTFMNSIFITQVLAQEPVAFGEIKPIGDVMVGSSTNEWVRLNDIYPLLKSTKLLTKEGTAFIATKDGLKIRLLENTEASIVTENSDYSVNLTKGALSFSTIPSLPFSIIAAQTTISAVPGTNSTNVEGMVHSSGQGTEIRCISGDIKVSFLGSDDKTLKAGEKLFVSSSGAVGEAATETKKETKEAQVTESKSHHLRNIVIGSLVIAGGTIAALAAFGHGGGGGGTVASPSAP
jgi:hypothetical protein